MARARTFEHLQVSPLTKDKHELAVSILKPKRLLWGDVHLEGELPTCTACTPELLVRRRSFLT